MSTRHATDLGDLLTKRGIKRKSLAQALGTDASTVSRWCNGLIPGQRFRDLIRDEIDLTAEEIVALGWDKEPASV